MSLELIHGVAAFVLFFSGSWGSRAVVFEDLRVCRWVSAPVRGMLGYQVLDASQASCAYLGTVGNLNPAVCPSRFPKCLFPVQTTLLCVRRYTWDVMERFKGLGFKEKTEMNCHLGLRGLLESLLVP